MKRYLSAAIVLAAAITGLPAIPARIWRSEGAPRDPGAEAPPAASAEAEDAAGAAPAEEAPSPDEPYRVLDVSTGEIVEVSARDYVIGAVCAEEPASFGEEALKAQAVAARTYAERQRARARRTPSPELKGADFSNDPSKYQGFFTKEEAERYMGEGFEEGYAKISAAVDEVLPYEIVYEGEPIIAAFHSMSSGRTESAENAWGAAVDYLVPVDSPSDKTAPRYMEEVRCGEEVFRKKLEEAFPGITLPEKLEDCLKVEEVSDSGTVLKAKAGDMEVTGNDIREAFSLRSACFDVRFEGGEAVFVTRGYGHGVGMSQYGANALAAEGKSWRDILALYYPGCEIKEIAELRR